MCIAAMFLAACGSESNDKGTVTQPSGVSTSPERAVNPPHGMPGHTCAVPDGAPLPEGAAQPQLQVNPPVQREAQSLPVDAGRTIQINPAHGQPGHRCDIAVGAPLG